MNRSRATGTTPTMGSRASRLVLRLCCAAVTVINIEGCGCWGFELWDDVEVIALGTEADLFAVDSIDDYVAGGKSYEHLAVGADGAVVAWGHDGFHDSGRPRLFVDHWTVGAEDLRAIWTDPSSGWDPAAWWVIGDGGFAAVSEDLGETWTTVELGTSANLRGITNIDDRLVIVGDDVVLVRAIDATWSEILPPDGEWGSLRAIYADEARTYAIGLAGVIWSAGDPVGPWTRETSVVTTDLLAIGPWGDSVIVGGAAGTLLIREDDWSVHESGVSVDLIAYERGYMLGADGWVFDVGGDPIGLWAFDEFGAGRAIDRDYWGGLVVVGDGGEAYRKTENDPDACAWH